MPDGCEKGPIWAVLRLFRLSRLQDDKANRRRAEKIRRAAGREVSAVRQQHGDQARALWRVHRLQQLPDVQVREAENHWRSVSQLQRRRSGGAALQARQNVLRLQSLSRVRFCRLGKTAQREMPRLRSSVS